MPRRRTYRRAYRRAPGRGALRKLVATLKPEEKRLLFGPTYLQRLSNTSLGEQTLPQKWMRRATGYRGEGDYWDTMKSWVPKGTFSAAGSFLGNAYGGAAGGSVGGAIGNRISKWAGFGDYGPTTHNQIAGGEGGPITVNASDDMTGDVFLSHKEFVGNVRASATIPGASLFQQTQYPLNPGLSTSFPFLSQIASNFELYDFQGLMFEFRPTSGESSSASNSLGKVIFATQYDPDSAPFLNSVQMQNYDYSASTKPSCGMVHGVETAQHQQVVNMMYVRTGNSPKAKVFTDLGFLSVATEGIPFSATGTQILGELWVTYRVKLSRANLYNSLLGLSINFDKYMFTPTAGNMLGAVVPFASGEVERAENSGLWKFSATNPATGTTSVQTIHCSVASNVIAGCFMISIYIREPVPTIGMSVNTITPSAVAGFTGITFVQQSIGGASTLNSYVSAKAIAEDTMVVNAIVSVNNTNGNSPFFSVAFLGILPVLSGNLISCTATQVPCSVLSSAGVTTI